MDYMEQDYEILKAVGKGGSSTVYKGRFISTQKIVAIKQIDMEGLSNDQWVSINEEIEMIKNLHHDHIVSYLGTRNIHTNNANKILIFLEYADRGSLRQFYQRRGALKEPQVANCTRQILQGLYYLHSNGIAHRDIKCANCLLTKGGVIKLADFGASKRYDADSVVSGLKGTPHWMAPEVIRGNQMTTGWMKADVWSVGCTVVEMLTGRLPFSNYDNQMTAMYHIANGEAPVVTGTEVSSDLQTVITDCCAVAPENRPACDMLLAYPFLNRHRSGSPRTGHETATTATSTCTTPRIVRADMAFSSHHHTTSEDIASEEIVGVIGVLGVRKIHAPLNSEEGSMVSDLTMTNAKSFTHTLETIESHGYREESYIDTSFEYCDTALEVDEDYVSDFRDSLGGTEPDNRVDSCPDINSDCVVVEEETTQHMVRPAGVGAESGGRSSLAPLLRPDRMLSSEIEDAPTPVMVHGANFFFSETGADARRAPLAPHQETVAPEAAATQSSLVAKQPPNAAVGMRSIANSSMHGADSSLKYASDGMGVTGSDSDPYHVILNLPHKADIRSRRSGLKSPITLERAASGNQEKCSIFSNASERSAASVQAMPLVSASFAAATPGVSLAAAASYILGESAGGETAPSSESCLLFADISQRPKAPSTSRLRNSTGNMQQAGPMAAIRRAAQEELQGLTKLDTGYSLNSSEYMSKDAREYMQPQQSVNRPSGPQTVFRSKSTLRQRSSTCGSSDRYGRSRSAAAAVEGSQRLPPMALSGIESGLAGAGSRGIAARDSIPVIPRCIQSAPAAPKRPSLPPIGATAAAQSLTPKHKGKQGVNGMRPAGSACP